MRGKYECLQGGKERDKSHNYIVTSKNNNLKFLMVKRLSEIPKCVHDIIGYHFSITTLGHCHEFINTFPVAGET